MKNLKKIFIVFVITAFININAFAQLSGTGNISNTGNLGTPAPQDPILFPPNDDPEPPGPDPIDTPFDSGLAFLGIAAVVYGIRRRRNMLVNL